VSPIDPRGLRVARRYARWHIGDPYWADAILDAYLNPDAAEEQLRRERDA
jgi:hypothetical protein